MENLMLSGGRTQATRRNLGDALRAASHNTNKSLTCFGELVATRLFALDQKKHLRLDRS